MPILMENRQPSVAKAFQDRLERFINVHPTGAKAVSRFAILPKNDCPVVLAWADPDKVGTKKHIYGAQVTSPEFAKKWIAVGLDLDDFDGGRNEVRKSGLVLIHYTKDAYEARELIPLIIASRIQDKEIKNFESNPYSRQVEGDKVIKSGQIKREARTTQSTVLAAAMARHESSIKPGGDGMPRIIEEAEGGE